jgi:hypothetical protein
VRLTIPSWFGAEWSGGSSSAGSVTCAVSVSVASLFVVGGVSVGSVVGVASVAGAAVVRGVVAVVVVAGVFVGVGVGACVFSQMIVFAFGSSGVGSSGVCTGESVSLPSSWWGRRRGESGAVRGVSVALGRGLRCTLGPLRVCSWALGRGGCCLVVGVVGLVVGVVVSCRGVGFPVCWWSVPIALGYDRGRLVGGAFCGLGPLLPLRIVGRSSVGCAGVVVGFCCVWLLVWAPV